MQIRLGALEPRKRGVSPFNRLGQPARNKSKQRGHDSASSNPPASLFPPATSGNPDRARADADYNNAHPSRFRRTSINVSFYSRLLSLHGVAAGKPSSGTAVARGCDTRFIRAFVDSNALVSQRKLQRMYYVPAEYIQVVKSVPLSLTSLRRALVFGNFYLRILMR